MNKGSESKMVNMTQCYSNVKGNIIYRSNINEISRNQNYCHRYNSFNKPIPEKEFASCEHLEFIIWFNKSIPT